MRILLVTDSYPPELSSAAELVKGLADALCARGHEITVLTTPPGYKLHRPEAAKEWPNFATDNGVSVVRARTYPLHYVSYIRRGLAVIAAPFQMWRMLRRHVSIDFDAAFIMSPPITLGLIAKRLKRRGIGVVFNVQDIFPQNAMDLGILRNPLLIAFFRWIEKLSYENAAVVTAHSESNLRLLRTKNPDVAGKFALLHNWVDPNRFVPQGQQDYRKLFELDGKVVAVFAGVVGPSQGVHMLMELAERVRDLNELVFLIVGDGTEKQRVVDMAVSRRLRNVVFKPYISQEAYPDLLQSCDIGVVCLSSDVKTPVVPGKILGYMVASLPVAAFVNTESDVHEIVSEAACGVSCSSADLPKMEAALRLLLRDSQERKQMGVNGRKYALENYSIERITDDIERMMLDIRLGSARRTQFL